MKIEKNADNCYGCDFRVFQTDNLYHCNRLDTGIWLIDVCETGRMVRLPQDVRQALALAKTLEEVWKFDKGRE